MRAALPIAESDLIAELRQAWQERGCQRAGNSLWRLMQPHIARTVRNFPTLQSEADDLLQMAAIRAFASLPRFDVSRPLGPWLRRLTQHVCVDHLRLLGRRREAAFSTLETALEQAIATQPSHGPAPAARLMAGEQTLSLQRAVSRLPRPERRVMEALLAEEMDPARTAARLGCDRSALKSRVCRARIRLRKEWLAMAA